MVTELLVLGFIFFVLMGAISFYFYSRLLYVERKINLLETILLDIKMTMEMEDTPQSFNANFHGRPVEKHIAPIIIDDLSGTSLSVEESAVTKEQEEYYNDVLVSTPSVQANDVLPVSTKYDYDTMTREELVTLDEKRSIRVAKGTRKQALVSLLREADKNSSNDHETGKGDASGMVTGNLEQSSEGAPLDVVETDTLSMESPV